LTNTTTAHIDHDAAINTVNAGASSTEGLAVAATNTSTITSIAGSLAIGGSAGIGAGVDVEVITKHTNAWIAHSSQRPSRAT